MASQVRASIRGTSGSGRVAPDLLKRQTAAQKQKMLNTIGAGIGDNDPHRHQAGEHAFAPAPLASENSPVLIQAL